MFLTERLKIARNRAGLTLQQAATELALDRMTIYNWEAGRGAPRADSLVKLAGLYGVNVGYFFDQKRNRAGAVLAGKAA